MINTLKNKKGFTLIELLVVVSIIGILITLSVFSIQNSKKSARDAKRKSDMELIRSGLEFYMSDCGKYPEELGNVLRGDDSSSTCLVTNNYIGQAGTIPLDPKFPLRVYLYYSDGTNYEICTALESIERYSVEPVTCGDSSSCGETACNFKVTNP